MKNFFYATFLLMYTDFVLACPGCAGSMGSKKDEYTVYLLMTFIVLAYIPFYFIYKTAFKYRNINKIKND